MNLLLEVFQLFCLLYFIHKNSEKTKIINWYKEENERLKAEIESLKTRQ